MKKGVALKGSITIFLAMIFTVLLAFVCVLLENARVSSAASKAEGITYMGLDSCFAEYAKELFENLKIWDEVSSKASLGTNVTEVLNWVAEGSADSGIVYSTDASSKDKVEVVIEAPEGSVSKIIYPVGIIKASKHKEEAKNFTDFLQSNEAMKVFESYGFSSNI